MDSTQKANPAGSTSGTRVRIQKLVEDLHGRNSLEIRRKAVTELRNLTRDNTENRTTIARCGAIGPLVALLSCPDPQLQENATTALVNLSMELNQNKIDIAAAGAIRPLIHLLEKGSKPEVRENAAAALFSLSVMEKNNIIIGRSGAIPPLVDLLRTGSLGGKNDAVTALYNLSIVPENNARILNAGALQPLMELMDPAAGMVDKVAAVLANLSTTPHGRNLIVKERRAVPFLVQILELGSHWAKQNAAEALLQLCTNSRSFCTLVLIEGAIPPLVAICQSRSHGPNKKVEDLLFHLKRHRYQILRRRRDQYVST